MRDEIAKLVQPVFDYALRLKERLERGETLDFYSEQSALKGLLLSELESRRLPDFGGDAGAVGEHTRGGSRRGGEHFLGIRYALVCWLDEIYILDSTWETVWTERKIEEALYGTNDRAWNFWEQAHLAEARPGSDAIEAYYLCVMLGFRGDLRDKPDKLRAWADAASKRISREQGKEWTIPPELEASVNVPPLRGRERLHKMVLIVAAFTFGLVPILAFFLLSRILQQH